MKKIIMAASVAMLMLAAGACERYEDGRPSNDVRSQFSEMYPGAWDVEWENKGGMWEVSFETGSRPDGTEHEAWYDMQGNWVKTVTDVLLSSVPQNVKDALSASEFASGQMDDNDAEYHQSPSGDFYRFDMRIDGRKVEVDVTSDGMVSQAVKGLW